MKWNVEELIQADIETVYKTIDIENEETREVLMPNVVSNIKIEGEDLVYRQKYKEGKKIVEYDVHIMKLIEKEDKKQISFSFNLNGMFEVEGTYLLIKSGDNTKLIYKGSTTPLKWYIKVLLAFSKSNDKVARKYVVDAKNISENIKI